jgi:hypothetical protein
MLFGSFAFQGEYHVVDVALGWGRAARPIVTFRVGREPGILHYARNRSLLRSGGRT